MRLRRNVRWWAKVSVAAFLFLLGTYLTVRQAQHDASLGDKVEVRVQEKDQGSESDSIAGARRQGVEHGKYLWSSISLEVKLSLYVISI